MNSAAAEPLNRIAKLCNFACASTMADDFAIEKSADKQTHYQFVPTRTDVAYLDIHFL